MQRLLGILEFVDEIYKQNASSNDRFYELCTRYAKLTRMIVISTLCFYVFIFLAVMLPSAVEYLLTKQFTPILHVYFIGIKEYSTATYAMAIAYNFATAFLKAILQIPTDATSLMSIVNFPFMAAIIDGKLSDLDQQLDSTEKRYRNDRQTKLAVFKIALMHGKYIECVADIWKIRWKRE